MDTSHIVTIYKPIKTYTYSIHRCNMVILCVYWTYYGNVYVGHSVRCLKWNQNETKQLDQTLSCMMQLSVQSRRYLTVSKI